ncbi:response regulator [Cohnella hongkongensis]|uniref:Response regulator n=1 Tax=Cohnella hongkongensis TaxID=178337 RepID=A0ABV9FM72_9BACL
MFKLIIVDDFKIERENVKDIIVESGLELEVCGEYSNGKDALLALERDRPDFIITDIEMPFMDGLTFGEKVRERYPQIKVILFSFHSKFEYAKKAIDLEAYAYILKPIIDEELVGKFRELIEQRKAELRKRQEEEELKKLLEASKPLLVDSFKRSLFLGMDKDSEEIGQQFDYLKLDRPGARLIVLAVEVDDYEQAMAGKSREEKEMHALRISRILDRQSAGSGFLWSRISERLWALLVSGDAGEETLKTTAYGVSAALIASLKENGISVSVGISPVARRLDRLSEMYEQAVHSLEYKFRLGKGQMIRCEDISDGPGSYSIPYSETQNEIAAIFHARDRERAEAFVDGLFGRIEAFASESETKNMCFTVVLYTHLALNSMNVRLDSIYGREQLLWERLMQVETIADVKTWLKNTFFTIIAYMESSHGPQYGRMVEEAIKSIRRNFRGKITVKSIADELMYSANYLNNVFKQKTGETILEHITKVRMEEAKRLIADDPGMKTYELAEAVGYNDESYFRSVFKQYTGLTPKEYKDSL